MPRKRDIPGEKEAPPWLMTFADLVTLMFTFFILLLSLAVIDERSKLVVLGSVNKKFGYDDTLFNPIPSEHQAKFREPGPMDLHEDDLAAMRDMIFDDASKDLDFQENRYVQILSINERVLFVPGQPELSREGMELLDRFLPYFQRIRHPLLVAGHTAPRRDEEGGNYSVLFADGQVDSTWLLSFQRATAVYRHLTARGIPPEKLMLEAFGQFHPRYGNNSPEERQRNRRVDIVLDKRNREWIDRMDRMQSSGEISRQAPVHYVRGFKFDLTMPGQNREGRP